MNKVQQVNIKIGKEKMRFKVYEVISVSIDEEIYRPVKINNKYQLGLLIKEGYLSLLKYSSSEDATARAYSSSILVKIDGSQLIVPNLGFKKQLTNFLGDCDLVKDNFLDNAYKKSELDKIVDDYNACIKVNTENLNKKSSYSNPNSEKVKQIETLIKAIKAEEVLPDTADIIEMLNDLSEKISEGDKIPAYLKTSLQSSLKNNTAFSNQLNQILE